MKTPSRPVLNHVHQKVYDFLLAAYRRCGVLPSLREIAAEMGYRSQQSVVDALNTLETNGYIRRASHVDRAIVLVDAVDLLSLPALCPQKDEPAVYGFADLFHDTCALYVADDHLRALAHLQQGDYVIANRVGHWVGMIRRIDPPPAQAA